MDSPCSSSGSNSTKLQNKFTKETHNVSYVGLHSEVKSGAKMMPPSLGDQMSQGRSKGLHKEELVRYMSEVPSYLEKGEKAKVIPLNIGVLDWHTLENWKNYHPQRTCHRYSTSSSITSSAWTAESSNHCRRGDGTCSPRNLKERRASLQSYLNIPPIDRQSEDVECTAESSARNATYTADDEVLQSNPSDGQQNILRGSALRTKSSKLKLKEQAHDLSETRSRGFKNHKGVSSSKGKMEVQGDASEKESEKLQNQHSYSVDQVSPDSYKDVTLPWPRNSAEDYLSHPFDRATENQELKESSATSLDKSHLKKGYSTEPYPSNLDSSTITHEIVGHKESHMEQKFSCSPICETKSGSQATDKILKEKSSNMTEDSNSAKSLKVLNKKGADSDSAACNPAPGHRLSFVLNRIRRSYNSKDSSDIPQFSSEEVTAKSGSEMANSFVCPNDATCDQSNAASRERSSALKRLLNPLMKAKVANLKFADQPQRNLTSTHRASATFDEQGQGAPSFECPLKLKLDMTNMRNPNLDETDRNSIKGSSTVKAYVQVSAKDDLPLFTFAVDNNSDVLAATLRNFSTKKDDPTWIYTFFSIQNTRKSGGWLTQGSRSKDYVPSAVAQMKVSDLPFPNLGGHNTVDLMSTREFVLYAVDLRLFDYQICDMQPNDEIAAIVVKFPRKIITHFQDSLQSVKPTSNSRGIQEDKSFIESQELFSTTVLLPGGIHGLPSKGEPSPLIDRWLSGGQCDCGGWDMGCKVKVLGNNNQRPNSKFELFPQSQEEAQQTTSVFMLSSLKNGVFSVEFSPALSVLQAFSICVAVFDSMKPPELQQPSKFFQDKLAEEATLPHYSEPKIPNLVEVAVPTRFLSQPPPSPVGRV